jgi:hypothetical protein
VFAVFLNEVNVVHPSMLIVLSFFGMPVVYLWTTFTYIGKEWERITEFFKETPIEIAFRTQYET